MSPCLMLYAASTGRQSIRLAGLELAWVFFAADIIREILYYRAIEDECWDHHHAFQGLRQLDVRVVISLMMIYYLF